MSIDDDPLYIIYKNSVVHLVHAISNITSARRFWYVPMDGDVISCKIVNSNQYSVTFFGFDGRPRELTIYRQNFFCMTETRVWSFFYLQQYLSNHHAPWESYTHDSKLSIMHHAAIKPAHHSDHNVDIRKLWSCKKKSKKKKRRNTKHNLGIWACVQIVYMWIFSQKIYVFVYMKNLKWQN